MAEEFKRNKCILWWYKRCGFCIPFSEKSAYTIALGVGFLTFYST
jgi:hypothetical protein